MKNPKLLHLISSSNNSGPFNVVINILQKINLSNYNVECFTYKASTKKSKSRSIEKLGIKHELINNLFKLSFKIYNNKYNLIHTHCYSSLIIAIFFKNKAKHIHTFHAYPEFQNIYIYGKIKGCILNFIIFYFYKFIDMPIACSPSVADEFYKYKNISLDFVMNGIPDNYNILSDKYKMREKYKFDSQYKYFITVGRLSIEKNIIFLVDSFIRANCKNVKLIIIGDGPLVSNIKSNFNNDIILIQYTDVVFDYLFCSDYYISASKIEGMSLSILEAMSAKLPLIISNILPHKYIFNFVDNSNIGEIFNVEDVDGLINAIHSILKHDQVELGKASRAIFENYFDSNMMSQKYFKIYSNLLNA